LNNSSYIGSPVIIEKTESLHKWFVVCVSTLVLVGVYGTQLSFGVFLKPISLEFGWTRTLVSGAVSIVIGLAGPLGVLTGVIADRYGARKIIAVGGLFAVSGYLLISRANSLWELYVFFGVFLGITISTTWSPLIGTVSRYFTKKRVLAIGILTSGNTMGSMFVPPIIAHFMGANGWRASFFILAIIMVVTITPSLFILGRESDQRQDTLGQGAGLKGDEILERKKSMEAGQWPAIEAVKTLAFFMVVTVGFVTAVGFFIIAVHMVPYATDMGINATSAALILSFLSMGNIVGKLLAWPITRSIGERFSLLLFVGLQAFTFFSLINADSQWILFILGAIYGFGLGGSMALRMSIIPEYFGTKSVSTLIGITGNAWGLGGFVGPILAGYIFDISYSYNLAFITGGTLLLAGMVASILLKPPRPRLQSQNI